MKTLKEVKEIAENYNFVAILQYDNLAIHKKVYTASIKSVHSIAATCLFNGGLYTAGKCINCWFLGVPKDSDFFKSHKTINTACRCYYCTDDVTNELIHNSIPLNPKDFYLCHKYSPFGLIYFTDAKSNSQMVWKGNIESISAITNVIVASGNKNVMYKEVTEQEECSHYVNIKRSNRGATRCELSESVLKEFIKID